jgi:hypothetical protein
MARRYVAWSLAAIGFIGSIASVFGTSRILTYTALAVLAIGGSLLLVEAVKSPHFQRLSAGARSTLRRARHQLLVGEHPALFAMSDLHASVENSSVHVTKMVRNIQYTDNNRTSNVSTVVEGYVVEPEAREVTLVLGAGSPVSNLSGLKYGFFVDNDRIANPESFNFLDPQSDIITDRILSHFDIVKSTPFAHRIIFKFDHALHKNDMFQVAWCYAWSNSIIDKRSSTYNYTRRVFIRGVDNLVVNLIFTRKPFAIVVYQIVNKRVQPVVQQPQLTEDPLGIFTIHLNMKSPTGTVVIERELEGWQ